MKKIIPTLTALLLSATVSAQEPSLYDRVVTYTDGKGSIQETYRVTHYLYKLGELVTYNRGYNLNGVWFVEQYDLTSNHNIDSEKGISRLFQAYPTVFLYNDEVWVDYAGDGLNGNETPLEELGKERI